MIFQRINRTNAETAFGVFDNVNGSTLYGNYPVQFCVTSGSADGYSGVDPDAGFFAMAGVVDVDTANRGVGLYQCYGYRDSVRVFAHGTSATVGAGVVMGFAASNGVSSTGLLDSYGPVIAMEAIGAAVTSPGGFGKAFIRML